MIKTAYRAIVEAGDWGVTDVELADQLGVDLAVATRVRRALRRKGRVYVGGRVTERGPARPGSTTWIANRRSAEGGRRAEDRRRYQ